ncbi:M20 family metallopeptidase [Natronorarus salvus]|uniref:M20 family metallopeptidase n=1 Tax=Natronorarus salvus TaxID=3117733 RepID=UPI002F26CA35
MDDVERLTRELCTVPSHEDETAVGDLIERWLREETDADVERDAVGNVIARRGSSSGPQLALVGHHDVVPPDEGQIEDGEYVVEGRDGRLYGRGTADMKGSVAAAMCAFEDAEPTCELVFASFVGEETGGRGARYAIENGFSPEYAVVGEGSTNYSGEDVTDVVIAHKGRRGGRIVARGRAEHASRPEAGENAIYRACDAVGLVRGMEAPTVSVFGHDLSGSVAVTEIDGGSAMNVIPERCEATVDERTVPGEYLPLKDVSRIEGVEWEVESDLPPMRCSDGRFAEATLDAAAESQEARPELVTKPHATDAGRLARAGTACVVCGAAEPGEAHTEAESVSVDVLRRCYRIYRNVSESEAFLE